MLLLDADHDGVIASRDLEASVRRSCLEVHGEEWTRVHVHVREASGGEDANALLAAGELLGFVEEFEKGLGTN